LFETCFALVHGQACAGASFVWFVSRHAVSNARAAADVISAVEFDADGSYLATGDKGGRVVLFEKVSTLPVSIWCWWAICSTAYGALEASAGSFTGMSYSNSSARTHAAC
jgi:hypothetical protein